MSADCTRVAILLCVSQPPVRAQDPASSLYSLQSTEVVSRHTSGAVIGVALAFYTSRHCVIFGNRGENGAAFFFYRTLAQLMSSATNQTPPEVTEADLYICISYLLQKLHYLTSFTGSDNNSNDMHQCLVEMFTSHTKTDYMLPSLWFSLVGCL